LKTDPFELLGKTVVIVGGLGVLGGLMFLLYFALRLLGVVL